MAASFQKDSFIGWTRFRHRDFQCTVVRDGPLKMGKCGGAFANACPGLMADQGPWVDNDYFYRVLDTLYAIVEETGKSVPQIALNWLLQRPPTR